MGMNAGIFRRTTKHLAPVDKAFVVGMVFLRIFLVSFDLAGIALVGVVVSLVSGTRISQSSNLAHLLSYLQHFGLEANYIGIAVLAIVFFTVKGLVSIWLTHLTGLKIARIEARKASDIFTRLVSSKLDYQDEYTPQDILHALGPSIYTAFSQTITVGVGMVGEIVLIISISIYLASVNLTLFFVVAAFFGAIGGLMALLLGKSSGRAAAAAHSSSLASQGTLLATLDNFRQIATSQRKESFKKAFSDYRLTNAIEYANYVTLSTLPRYITEIAVMLGVGILVVLRSGSGGLQISSTTIAIFLAGIFRIVASMLPLQSGFTTVKRIAPQSELAFRMLDQKSTPGIRMTDTTEETEGFQISFQNVSFRYQKNGKDVICDASFDLPERSYVAITGKSGAGKSSIADLMMGLRSPTQGSIMIGASSVSQYLEANPSGLAYVPQSTSLFEGSLLENLVLEISPKTVDQDHLKACLEAVNLKDFVDRLPEGLDTHVGATGIDLSGGQTQRVGLARAMYLRSNIVLLDEATSALDGETEEAIHEVLLGLRSEATVIVIAHRPQTLQDADIVIEVSNHRVHLRATRE